VHRRGNNDAHADGHRSHHDRQGDVLLGGKAATPGRVLFAQDAFALAMPEAQQALQPALERVTRVIGKAEPVTVSAEGLNEWFEVFRIIQFAEIWETHREWVTREKPNFGIAIGKREIEDVPLVEAIPRYGEGLALPSVDPANDEAAE